MKSEQPQQVKVKTVTPVPVGPPKSGILAFWEKHGGRVLLVAVVIALLVLLLQYRRSTILRAEAAAATNLGATRDKVAQFRSTKILRLPADQIIQEAKSLETEAVPALEAVASDPDQPKFAAQARVTLGDLYWTLANLPEAPGATTQPSLRLSKPPTDYLTRAANAYQGASTAKGADPVTTVAARFGLGAVYENQEKWDEARKLYADLAVDTYVSEKLPSLKALATFRGALIENIRRPMFSTATTLPVSMPSALPGLGTGATPSAETLGPLQNGFSLTDVPTTTTPTAPTTAPAASPTTLP